MRKEGQELEGMKEQREGQTNEEGVKGGHAASPCSCSLRCSEADRIVKAPAQKEGLSFLQALANAIERNQYNYAPYCRLRRQCGPWDEDGEGELAWVFADGNN